MRPFLLRNPYLLGALAALLLLGVAAGVYLGQAPARAAVFGSCAEPRSLYEVRDVIPAFRVLEGAVNEIAGPDGKTLYQPVEYLGAEPTPARMGYVVEVGKGVDFGPFGIQFYNSKEYEVVLERECNDGGWRVTRFEERKRAKRPPLSSAPAPGHPA